MPSRRTLVGVGPPSDGPRGSEFQWLRVCAFFSGLGVTGLYLWIDPFQQLPGWTAAALSSVPVGLLLYGVTEQSWRTTLKIAAGTGVGLGLGAYLDAVGISLF
jgi:hypothetical protein